MPLQGKDFDILWFFVENPGQLLSKDALFEKVWGDSFVEEGNLARHVSKLRNALRDTGRDHRYIVTVPRHGYKFVAEVQLSDDGFDDVTGGTLDQIDKVSTTTVSGDFSKKWLWIFPIVALLLCTPVWVFRKSLFQPAGQIKSLAILPLRSLDASDRYIGIGIADAVISRVSQTRELIVRPTSAVLHFADTDTDALTAARELSTDAVLDGTVMRSADRLRVSVNLLRTSDGSSMWADNFDMPISDIFSMQDNLARQVAARLQLHLDSTQHVASTNRYPSNPIAYEFYIKGVFSLDERNSGDAALPQMEISIDLLKKAIEADPNYGLAHAQLAWAYVWTAVFVDVDQKWADLAREEIKRSQELDSNLAETHLAHALLLWSGYGGYQNNAAIREMLLAQQLDPNSGHDELAWTYAHVGLESLASNELNRALEINPTSPSLKDLRMILPWLRADAYGSFSERLKMGSQYTLVDPWYYLRMGRLDEAKKSIDERLQKAPDYDLLMQQALLLALNGDFRNAEVRIPRIIAKIQLNDHHRHHSTYDAACIFALGGKGSEAVKWLRETAGTGFPNYPLFERDPFLDRIRQTPEFVQFLAEQKTRWERLRQEFGG